MQLLCAAARTGAGTRLRRDMYRPTRSTSATSKTATSAVSTMVFEQGASRVESGAVAVGPNVFYTGRPAQLALVQASFPPRPPTLPTAGTAWARGFKPLMLAVVGATFAGQAVAFFMQLRNGEKDFED